MCIPLFPSSERKSSTPSCFPRAPARVRKVFVVSLAPICFAALPCASVSFYFSCSPHPLSRVHSACAVSLAPFSSQHSHAPEPCKLSEHHAHHEPAVAPTAECADDRSVSEQHVPVMDSAGGGGQARVPIEEGSRIAGSQLDGGSPGTSNDDRCIGLAGLAVGGEREHACLLHHRDRLHLPAFCFFVHLLPLCLSALLAFASMLHHASGKWHSFMHGCMAAGRSVFTDSSALVRFSSSQILVSFCRYLYLSRKMTKQNEIFLFGCSLPLGASKT